VVTSHKPRPSSPESTSHLGPDGQLRETWHEGEEMSYRPRHAARHVVADPRTGVESPPERPRSSGRHAARSRPHGPAPRNGQPYGPAPRDRQPYGPAPRDRQPYGPAPRDLVRGSRGAAQDPRAAENALRERQLAGLNALFQVANATAVTEMLPALSLAPFTQSSPESAGPRVLALLKDPALRGALSLILSAVMAGGLGYVFWAFTAHYQKASAVGSVSAEVSAITFLASVGSLNLINVFARFLPEAGWHARRMILVSYGGVVLAGSLFSIIFMLTPLASGLILGGGSGRFVFLLCVVLNSVFMIQDGGLIGFGRSGWVPIENILVASARLAFLPLAATFLSAKIGILWSWALPMAVAVLVINMLNIGRLAGRQATQRPSLPRFGELGRFIAIESVTTAVAAAVSAFLPALVTRRLGATQGGYFYVPWIITTMASLLFTSILISMVREAVARPEKAGFTLRRSLGLVLLITIAGMVGCVFLSRLALAPLGPAYAANGTPLLRWVGFALPAIAVNLTYWATCLVRRRPWPVFAVNLATSAAIIGGVILLPHSADISRVGSVYCLVQWMIAIVVAIPTYKALRAVRERQESQ
jgi:O-antigen/teichoic acid export membrane protein